jgi:hypothetical protein
MLELGERSKDAEDQLAPRCGRVDCSTLASQDLQTDASAGKVMHHIYKVPKTAPKAIKLPDHERVALPEGL